MMEKKVTTIEVYVANDGKEFTNRLECLAHERKLADSYTLNEILAKVDDFIKLAFYNRKTLDDYNIKVSSIKLSTGKSYYPNDDFIGKKFREVMSEKGATVDYREVYSQMVDTYFLIRLTDEKYEELLALEN